MTRRIIYSLHLEIEADGEICGLVAPLDRKGLSKHIHAMPPKMRVIDLRMGDYLRFDGQQHRILNVQAYREAQLPDGYQPQTPDGYIVRPKA